MELNVGMWEDGIKEYCSNMLVGDVLVRGAVRGGDIVNGVVGGNGVTMLRIMGMLW